VEERNPIVLEVVGDDADAANGWARRCWGWSWQQIMRRRR